MSFYITTQGAKNELNVDTDLVIVNHNEQLIFCSLIDVEIANRKLAADIVGDSCSSPYLHNYANDLNVKLGRWGIKYQFKSKKMGNRNHLIIKARNLKDYCINWKQEPRNDAISRFCRDHLSVPVTSDIIGKLFDHIAATKTRYSSTPIEPLTIYTNNPAFSNVDAYKIDKTRLLNELSKVNTGLRDSEFNWEQITSTEDYLLEFLPSIKKRLQDTVKVLFNPNNVDDSIFEGKMKPYKGQVPIIQSCIEVLKRDKFVYLAGEPGLGKEQPLTAKILTPNGWSTMGEMKVGTKVIDREGKPCNVTGVFPQGLKAAYKVTFQDGTSTECGEEHLWACKNLKDRSKNREWQVKPLREMVDYGLRRTCPPSRAASGRKGSRMWSIPVVEAIQFEEKQLPIDPYFLGALLGDGALGGSSISLSMPDDKLSVLDKIKVPLGVKSVYDDGVYSTGTVACPRVRFTRVEGSKNPLSQGLMSLDLRGHGKDKFIPEIYLKGSVEQRLALLRGLMDTDGSNIKNRISFHNNNPQLIQDVAELIRSLGGEARIFEYDRTDDGKGIEYRINVKMFVNPFSLPAKAAKWVVATGGKSPSKFIDSVEYIGEVEQQCIMVDSPDNCYITDDYIVTHNTACSIKANHAAQKGNYVSLVLAPAATLKHWGEELKACIPQDINVVIIRKATDFIKIYNASGLKFDKPTYFIIGKETFKLDAKRIPGVNFKKREVLIVKKNRWGEKSYETKTIELACCPDCASPLTNPNRVDTVYLERKDFKAPRKSNYKCGECDSVLWQMAFDKTKKTSLIRFIQTKKVHFDSILVDEAHQSNSNSKAAMSIIATATRNLMKYGKKIILLSGTTNNGYSSALHNLLVALKSGELIEDDVLEQKDFVAKYGTLLGSDLLDDTDYARTGRVEIKESQFREVEGVNPICITKYLLNNYVFATLDDLGENLPDFNETFIPIQENTELVRASAHLCSDMKSANPYLFKMYQGSIGLHHVNNPNNWNPIIINGKDGEHVIYPKNMNITTEKEKKLLEIVKQEISEGRRIMIYASFTGGGDYMSGPSIPQRLQKFLKEAGIPSYWLKPNIKTIDRKQVLDEQIKTFDCFISNPLLAGTGVNLQAIPSYLVYHPSYKVIPTMQAIRRGYRVNSTMENRVFHLYCEGTLETDIMSRYNLKVAELSAVESKFNVNVIDDNVRTASGLSSRLYKSMSTD